MENLDIFTFINSLEIDQKNNELDINQVYEEYLRFQYELEFVQMLANPKYVYSQFIVLANNGYFNDQRFLNYLKYLSYWKKPQYLKYIKYPQCLKFLELIQDKNFLQTIINPETQISNPQAIIDLENKQYEHWIKMGNNNQNQEVNQNT